MSLPIPGTPPPFVTNLLRIEGLAVAAAAIAGYWLTGGNWWLFALLLLAPDLAFLGYVAGATTGAWVYNFVHTYSVAIAVGAVGWFGGVPVLIAVALIWTTHIGLDRALGYGLKYPGIDGETHLGPMGKAKSGRAHAS